MENYYRCYTEISIPAIRHNLAEVRRYLHNDTFMWVVVKADAYGHGAIPVCHGIEDVADGFAVADEKEGLELRNAGIEKPILLLGYSSPSLYEETIKNRITPVFYEEDQAVRFAKTASKLGIHAEFHTALDTGMTRIGFRVTPENADTIARMSKLPGASLTGMFSHFSCADMTDRAYSEKQAAEFDEMRRLLAERQVEIPLVHLCNSAGITEYNEHIYTAVRSGIITYGLFPSDEVDKTKLDLIPAMQWKAHVVNIREVEPGRGVGYGATYVTEKPVTRIATVSAGYADGYPRAASGKARVIIRGKIVPVIGRVCMDQMMVDVTDIPDVQLEDTVTLFGTDGDSFIPVEELAENSGTINYEQVCRISRRVNRIYL